MTGQNMLETWKPVVGYKITDPETGRRASQSSWPSKESAYRQIDSWLERCDRGGRPDISREYLERLIVEEE